MQSNEGFRLSLTCESCGYTEHHDAKDHEDCLRQYHAFRCPQGCGPNLHSYIAVPKIKVIKTAFFA